ncbi:MAG: GDP-mannose 4,6-dehydratase [Candidatus Omnitrophica bacterium]|nr:GDP-mannose 4,6-dehydratase [Candidatus Omnitrophota bacterium]
MKKILVTGAAGFIGSHLTELCVRKGLAVKALVRYNSQNHWGWLEQSDVKNDIEIVTGDVRDYDSVSKALKDCEAVFHLAALIGIPYSYVSPLAYIKTNVEGTYNILEAAKQQQLKQILITSTSETYGTAQYVPINEEHPLVAQSPYAASKIAADQLALSYYRSFGLPVKVVRPFNTFGPRQSARAVIPTIITQILSGQKEIKLGNLTPTRDFTFVRDTAEAFWAVYQSPDVIGQVVNVGRGEEISIGQLAQEISILTNRNIEVVSQEQRTRVKDSEVERLCADSTKLQKLTTWKPQFDLKTGLQETIQWFESRLNLYKAEVYNV